LADRPCTLPEERLKDKGEGLGIELDFSVDPLTVVAQGAAIFAGTQQMKESLRPTPEVGVYRVELEYKPVGSDTGPLVGGRVVAPNGESLSGYTIEFVNETFSVGWRSGKVPINGKGSFTTELRAQKGKRNIFKLHLFDASGTTLSVAPDQFTYTVGMAITDPPLIHSVGVALANNQVLWFIKKVSPSQRRRMCSEPRNVGFRSSAKAPRPIGTS
jgi:molecular chaperone DnaK